jgi:hypothetical protein
MLQVLALALVAEHDAGLPSARVSLARLLLLWLAYNRPWRCRRLTSTRASIASASSLPQLLRNAVGCKGPADGVEAVAALCGVWRGGGGGGRGCFRRVAPAHHHPQQLTVGVVSFFPHPLPVAGCPARPAGQPRTPKPRPTTQPQQGEKKLARQQRQKLLQMAVLADLSSGSAPAAAAAAITTATITTTATFQPRPPAAATAAAPHAVGAAFRPPEFVTAVATASDADHSLTSRSEPDLLSLGTATQLPHAEERWARLRLLLPDGVGADVGPWVGGEWWVVMVGW